MNSVSQAQIDKIRAIVLDIDGVMTDGRFGYGAGGEIKFFNAVDGHGIKMALRAGLMVGVLSGRSCEANRQRIKELGMSFALEGCKDKRAGFRQLLEENGLKDEECIFVGDDVVDIPVLRAAGIAVTVAGAMPYMDEFADFRTVREGGHGAVREVIDWLLLKQGKWEQQMEKYLS